MNPEEYEDPIELLSVVLMTHLRKHMQCYNSLKLVTWLYMLADKMPDYIYMPKGGCLDGANAGKGSFIIDIPDEEFIYELMFTFKCSFRFDSYTLTSMHAERRKDGTRFFRERKKSEWYKGEDK